MPPPPPPQWNLPRGTCSLFQQRQDCFHAEDGFKRIPINISVVPTPWGRGNEVNSTCLGKCCEQCLAHPNCKHWFVPPPKNVSTSSPRITLGSTVCVLMDGNSNHKHINNSFCIGASRLSVASVSRSKSNNVKKQDDQNPNPMVSKKAKTIRMGLKKPRRLRH